MVELGPGGGHLERSLSSFGEQPCRVPAWSVHFPPLTSSSFEDGQGSKHPREIRRGSKGLVPKRPGGQWTALEGLGHLEPMGQGRGGAGRDVGECGESEEEGGLGREVERELADTEMQYNWKWLPLHLTLSLFR